MFDRWHVAPKLRIGKQPLPMMHAREKSDPATTAMKPADKAERFVAEPRAGTEGNAQKQSTDWAQNRASLLQALDRIRQAASALRRPATKAEIGVSKKSYSDPDFSSLTRGEGGRHCDAERHHLARLTAHARTLGFPDLS
jgi:hypothetical protein